MLLRQLPLALIAPLLFSGCSGSKSRTLTLKPGRKGTFVALMSDQPTPYQQLHEPKHADEEAFDFTIESVPGKGIAVGRAVGDEQAAVHADESFVPASITKVITSGIALKHLGPDFRFRMQVRWTPVDNGQTARDLSVRADGDPLVSNSRVQAIVKELKTRGVTKISGVINLVSADPRKDQSIPAFGLDGEDYLNCYGARVQNFNYQRNCASLEIKDWGQADWQDQALEVPLRFEATDSQKGKRLILARDFDSRFGALKGYAIQSLPDKKPLGFALPVPFVKSWFGNVLLRELKNQGFNLDGIRLVENQPLSYTDSFEITSETLAQIAIRTNKPSDNYLAEALYKASATLGKSSNINEAAIEVERATVGDWLKSTGHEAYAGEILLYDGAGLSRANHVTPRAFLAALKAISHEPSFPALWESLPIAGQDGTLRGRMTTGPAARLVRAKTGTLKGVYQLAGYIPRFGASGEIVEYIPFVILTATDPKNKGGARAFQDRVVNELAAQINVAAVAHPPIPTPRPIEEEKH